MIRCPFCHATHVANTIFCNECGHYLIEDENRQTDPLETVEIGSEVEVTDEAEIAALFQQDTRPRAIQLKIGPQRREIEVDLDKAILLGRIDPSSNVFPEIDLTEEPPFSKSVSRRHARILQQEGIVVLEDLASVNGTYINGKRLDPYLPETLNTGDTVHLGKLMVEVKIINR
jgi:hypothetical protein